ncbi:uncharacterized protein SCODWIG_02879 [Saccharomycodes ludwigii]|uniref:Probable metalloreductase AIM14 n=1 Tax=Saccharomycodes ludwigii TaxID=36035 RepID=A0A376B8V7_9ASCO|nr:uncharacterized protein SCODWIG_02879 [Saccharomycodes ludwigii]
MWVFTILTVYHARPSVLTPFFIINVLFLIVHLLNYTIHATSVELLSKRDDYAHTNMIVVKLPTHKLTGGEVNVTSTGNFIPSVASNTETGRTSNVDTNIATKKFEFTDILPGSHIRLNLYRKLNPLYWLTPSHPYSIADCDMDEFSLIIRENPRRFKFNLGDKFTLCNLYPPCTDIKELITNGDKICLVAGGSGISFILSIFNYLVLNKISTGDVKYLKLIWIVRDIYDLHILKHVKFHSDKILPGNNNSVDIYITNSTINNDSGTASSDSSLSDDSAAFELRTMGANEVDSGLDVDDDLGSLEEEMDQEINRSYNPLGLKLENVRYHYGKKPDILTDIKEDGLFVPPSELLQNNGTDGTNDVEDGSTTSSGEVNDNTATMNTWLCCCGPQSLIDDGFEFASIYGVNYAYEKYQF